MEALLESQPTDDVEELVRSIALYLDELAAREIARRTTTPTTSE